MIHPTLTSDDVAVIEGDVVRRVGHTSVEATLRGIQITLGAPDDRPLQVFVGRDSRLYDVLSGVLDGLNAAGRIKQLEAADFSDLVGRAQRNFEDLKHHLSALTAAICPLPPEGWFCRRAAGHDGPCAALPVARETPGAAS